MVINISQPRINVQNAQEAKFQTQLDQHATKSIINQQIHFIHPNNKLPPILIMTPLETSSTVISMQKKLTSLSVVIIQF